MLLTASLHTANAASVGFNLVGPGVSGTIQLTYGPATDAKYGQAFEVTGISGTFTDTNNGLNLINVPILSLVPINNATPEVDNLLAPKDFSRFAVASGLSSQNNGFLTYSNLFWPNGSVQTASDYPFFGGVLDIYGLMFNIGGGKVVNFWSNGGPKPNSPAGPIEYGIAVATADRALDYTGGVAVVPEPGTLAFIGAGVIGLVAWRRRLGCSVKRADSLYCDFRDSCRSSISVLARLVRMRQPT